MIRLCVIGVLAYGSYAMCRTPLLPLFARDLGATPEAIGLVMSASTIAGVLLKLPAGVWSDAIGRRPLMLAAAMIFAVLPFTYLGVAALGGLIAVRFVHGSATAIMGPVMSATISDLAPPAHRATWLSTYATMQGVGQALAPIVAGVLIARGRYDLAFASAGLAGLAVPLLVARASLRPAPIGGNTLSHAREGLLEVLRERSILIASATHASYYVVNGALNTFLPLYAHERLGMSASAIGVLFGAQTAVTLAIRPVIGMASDRLGRRGAIASGLSICALGVGGVAMSVSPAALHAAVLFYAAGVAITTAATSAYITDVAPRARFGAAHGVFGTIYDIGDASGPLVGGVLVGALGFVATFEIMAAISVSAALIFIVLTRDANDAAARAARW